MTIDDRLDLIEASLSRLVNTFNPPSQPEINTVRIEIFDQLNVIDDTLDKLENAVSMIRNQLGANDE